MTRDRLQKIKEGAGFTETNTIAKDIKSAVMTLVNAGVEGWGDLIDGIKNMGNKDEPPKEDELDALISRFIQDTKGMEQKGAEEKEEKKVEGGILGGLIRRRPGMREEDNDPARVW